MQARLKNGLTIEYECFGSPSDPAVLLIMGFGGQMTHWPDKLCEALAAKQFHVIRFDNRDVGLSSKLDHLEPPNLKWAVIRRTFGLSPKAPYGLTEMMADAIMLLDALDIGQAHFVGASMGGMIAQLAAIHHPERVLTLTSIMSSTGNRKLPRGDREVFAALTTPPENPDDLDSIARRAAANLKLLMSPAFPASDEELLAKATADARRCYHPPGRARQFAASLTARDRRKALGKLSVPTAVIHGDSDPLIPLPHGEDTARAIPGARFHVIEGFAHDFPQQMSAHLAELIAQNADRARPD